jgi:hypothetical protein
MGGLPGALGIAGSLLGFHGGIAGGLLGGLTGNAGQLGSAHIGSDADGLTGGLSFGECRWFVPDLVRNFSSSVFFAFAAAFSRSSRLVPLKLLISFHALPPARCYPENISSCHC